MVCSQLWNMLFPMHYGSTNAFMKYSTAEIKAFLYMCNNMDCGVEKWLEETESAYIFLNHLL
jgi:hypothetical protein